MLASSPLAGIFACSPCPLSWRLIGQVGAQAAGQAGAPAGRQGGPGGTQAQSPFGAGQRPGRGWRSRRIRRRGGRRVLGPHVLAGTYNVSLVVDGKTLESRPLKVMADPRSF